MTAEAWTGYVEQNPAYRGAAALLNYEIMNDELTDGAWASSLTLGAERAVIKRISLIKFNDQEAWPT